MDYDQNGIVRRFGVGNFMDHGSVEGKAELSCWLIVGLLLACWCSASCVLDLCGFCLVYLVWFGFAWFGLLSFFFDFVWKGRSEKRKGFTRVSISIIDSMRMAFEGIVFERTCEQSSDDRGKHH